ncbi:unnamed protein product [Cylicocyclus nassatus]|uniref:Cortactin n=1 Tax=Cylicocyclus nassatus TaxID=53992 RepID=A0AA36H1B6_CYLNA|nr:unnamed protein product [Cylicocyclus nassatus]
MVFLGLNYFPYCLYCSLRVKCGKKGMSTWTTIGAKPPIAPKPTEEDEWETDPDFVNDMDEKASRWGAKTVEGSGHQGHFSVVKMRQEALEADKIHQQMPKTSEGYGGKFGVMTDRMDKAEVSFDYKGRVDPHASQKDYAVGFGGNGFETDRKDKSAAGWDEKVELSKHESQKDASSGYGGRFGVQKDRKDKSAVGWDEKVELSKHESRKDVTTGYEGRFGVQKDRVDKSAVGCVEHTDLTKHESQMDYKKGFGGKFGVQTDRQDKSAAGWDTLEQVPKHPSQQDYKQGFGGKFGVQSDRQDKSAVGYDTHDDLKKHESQMDYKKGFGGQFGVQRDRQDRSASFFMDISTGPNGAPNGLCWHMCDWLMLAMILLLKTWSQCSLWNFSSLSAHPSLTGFMQVSWKKLYTRFENRL